MLGVQKRRHGFGLGFSFFFFFKPALRVGGPLWGKGCEAINWKPGFSWKRPFWPFTMAYRSPPAMELRRETTGDHGAE